MDTEQRPKKAKNPSMPCLSFSTKKSPHMEAPLCDWQTYQVMALASSTVPATFAMSCNSHFR